MGSAASTPQPQNSVWKGQELTFMDKRKYSQNKLKKRPEFTNLQT